MADFIFPVPPLNTDTPQEYSILEFPEEKFSKDELQAMAAEPANLRPHMTIFGPDLHEDGVQANQVPFLKEIYSAK